MSQFYFSFKVYSALYGWTDAIINDIDYAIKRKFAPCGDGNDYLIPDFELCQLIDIRDGNMSVQDFVSAHSLKPPFNVIALMGINEYRLELPDKSKFELVDKDFKTIKTIMKKAGGAYSKNGYVFKEDAKMVFDRIISGQNYNLKKRYQFYPTVKIIADKMVKLANLKWSNSILEPSAGDGAIIKSIHAVEPEIIVDCFEMMTINIDILQAMDNVLVIGNDFTVDNPQYYGYYDRIIANPPFSNNQDIKHIYQMFKYLSKHGRIVTLCSTHSIGNNGKLEKEFEEFISKYATHDEIIDEGTFRESGTNVKTRLLVIENGTK